MPVNKFKFIPAVDILKNKSPFISTNVFVLILFKNYILT